MLFKSNDLTSPLTSVGLDVSPAILIPFYDEDSSTLFLTGRVRTACFEAHINVCFWYSLSPRAYENLSNYFICILVYKFYDIRIPFVIINKLFYFAFRETRLSMHLKWAVKPHIWTPWAITGVAHFIKAFHSCLRIVLMSLKLNSPRLSGSLIPPSNLFLLQFQESRLV